MSEKKYHIVHLSSADIWRGAEQQIVYLYQGLQKKGYQQTIICSENGLLAKYCQQQQYSFLKYHRESGINWNLVKKVKHLHQHQKIDVIHIHDPHAHHAYLVLYYLGFKIPAILHRRVDFPTAKNIFSKWKYENLGIKKIVCVSKQVQNILQTSKKTCVIYDCIAIEKFQKINGRKILEKDFPQLIGKNIIGNISALVDHKDHLTFIKSAHYLVKVLQIPNLHFLIVGSGELKEHIETLIQQYHLQDVVTMTGFRSDIPEILNGLDVYTFTSKMEGFGSTILEVMAAKVPIVATNIGGPAEILTHQVDCLKSKVGDEISLAHHIASILQDAALKNQLVQNAFQKVQEFTVDKYISQVEDIYHQIA